MSQRTRAHTTGAAARPTSSHAELAAAPAAGVNAIPAADDATPPRRGKPAAKATPAVATAAVEHGDALPLSPDALARALRAVATELERDPALAQRLAQAISETPAAAAPSEQRRESSRSAAKRPKARAEATDEPAAPPSIGRSFHPTIVTGVDDALGPGVPDPFALRARLGEAGLREALETLRLGSLRAIIRQHGMDAKGALSKVNDAEKLRAHILAKTDARDV